MLDSRSHHAVGEGEGGAAAEDGVPPKLSCRRPWRASELIEAHRAVECKTTSRELQTKVAVH